MAQKRMFDKTITNSDDFIDMPDSAQNLYFHLSMNADDDGFINNWKNIMRMTGHKEDDIKILIAKQYVIPFDSGVIVIRHWRINNYLRGDRYIETKYKAEKQQLQLDENSVYQLATIGIPLGIPTGNPDKNSIDKSSIDKIRVEEEEEEEKTAAAKDEVMEFYLNNINSAITPHEAEKIEKYEEELPKDLIIYAMQEAVEHKARSIAYIESILKRYLQNGITTLEEAKEKKNPWDEFAKRAERGEIDDYFGISSGYG